MRKNDLSIFEKYSYVLPSLFSIVVILIIVILRFLFNLNSEKVLTILRYMFIVSAFLGLVFSIYYIYKDLFSQLNIKKNNRIRKTSQKDKRMQVLPFVFGGLTFAGVIVVGGQIFSYFNNRDILVISATATGVEALKVSDTIIHNVPDEITISVITLIILGIGTLSTLFLGWRNDRRNQRESDIRLEKMELEIRQLKSQLDDTQKMIVTDLDKRHLSELNLSRE